MADIFYGTGWRHKVQQWPKSQVTNRCHKTRFPDAPDTNKLVLVIGDSHLRSFVEGVVAVPEDHISFGYSCTPGATAEELRKEIIGANIPLSPDLVILLAPSNNLTANMTTTEAGKDFTHLMAAVLHRWDNVIVLDFPPRLNEDIQYHGHLRNEYHRAAARMGLKYLSVVDHFPLKQSKLWCKDGIHLSDNFGTPILADLLWASAYLELNTTREFVSQRLAYRPPVFNPVIAERVRETFSPKAPESSKVRERFTKKAEADLMFAEIKKGLFSLCTVIDTTVLINPVAFRASDQRAVCVEIPLPQRQRQRWKAKQKVVKKKKNLRSFNEGLKVDANIQRVLQFIEGKTTKMPKDVCPSRTPTKCEQLTKDSECLKTQLQLSPVRPQPQLKSEIVQTGGMKVKENGVSQVSHLTVSFSNQLKLKGGVQQKIQDSNGYKKDKKQRQDLDYNKIAQNIVNVMTETKTDPSSTDFWSNVASRMNWANSKKENAFKNKKVLYTIWHKNRKNIKLLVNDMKNTSNRNENQEIQNTEIGPIQNTEIGPIQNTEIGPIQNTEIGPIQNTEIGPIQNTEIGPIQNTEIGPIQNTGQNSESSKLTKDLDSVNKYSNIISDMISIDSQGMSTQTLKCIFGDNATFENFTAPLPNDTTFTLSQYI